MVTELAPLLEVFVAVIVDQLARVPEGTPASSSTPCSITARLGSQTARRTRVAPGQLCMRTWQLVGGFTVTWFVDRVNLVNLGGRLQLDGLRERLLFHLAVRELDRSSVLVVRLTFYNSESERDSIFQRTLSHLSVPLRRTSRERRVDQTVLTTAEEAVDG